MENQSTLDNEYSELVENNPFMKFILYIRWHPSDNAESTCISELEKIFGECKKLPDKRLLIFIVSGNKVTEFIGILNSTKTRMYLSFIQTEEELLKQETP